MEMAEKKIGKSSTNKFKRFLDAKFSIGKVKIMKKV